MAKRTYDVIKKWISSTRVLTMTLRDTTINIRHPYNDTQQIHYDNMTFLVVHETFRPIKSDQRNKAAELLLER